MDIIDVLYQFPGWTTEFEPLFRQEYSRRADGVTIGKDFGDAIWSGAWTSKSLSPNELDYYRSRMELLEGVINRFRGYPLSRCRPILHPGSAVLPTGTLNEISSDRRSVRLSGLTGITLSPGDLIQIGTTDLHRVMEVVAPGSPTALFKIRPGVWPGVVTGATVSVSKPSCIMGLVPGSLTSTADPSTGRGSISFKGIEVR